jgi:hypothetical protein
MLEACHPFGDNGHVKMCLNEANPIVVYGGANYESSRSNNDQVMHSGLNEA